MVDLAPAASEVQPSSAPIKTATAGGTIAAGDLIQINSGTATVADVNDTTAAATVKGIAINSASSGQQVAYQDEGDITLGATAAPTAGTVYVLSESGAMSPAADLTSGDFVSVVGVGLASNKLRIKINNSGVQL